jgi:hypothetical protein
MRLARRSKTRPSAPRPTEEAGPGNQRFSGFAPLTVWTAAPSVDTLATATNDLRGWQFAVPITPYAEARTPGSSGLPSILPDVPWRSTAERPTSLVVIG